MKKVWCKNPDEAFNIGCGNLTSEDWCQDNSMCPLQRKVETMYVLVKKEISLAAMEEAEMVLQISKDRKRVILLKHRQLPNSEDYHISHLKNILLAGDK